MNISALNAPATPPYDYQNHTSNNHSSNSNSNNNNNKTYHMFFDRQSSDHVESDSVRSNTHNPTPNTDNEAVVHSAFRRVSPMSMPSPPELLIDSSEDEEDFATPNYINASSPTSPAPSSHSSSSSFSYAMHPNHPHHQHQKKRKSVPHRSPSNLVDHKSIVFQLSENCTPKILGGGDRGILWSLRQRVSMARCTKKTSRSRLSAPRPERRVRAMRIQIPRPQWSRDNSLYEDLVSPLSDDWQPKKSVPIQQPIVILPSTSTPSSTADATAESSWQKPAIKTPSDLQRKKSSTLSTGTGIGAATTITSATATTTTTTTPRRKSSHHASSGRPSRVKGPCQACHETSDGCMRKAFNWPFPTSTIFNDKGKPFVYLCNKCGLRYNKSGGCVCRHCRWVLCKEEKRKAMQLIDQMRRSRPDGRVDPEESIENFACTPKYWNCGRRWKVGWILNSQHDEEDEDALMMMADQSPSSSDPPATL